MLACGACGGITASFNAGTGILSFSGSATLAAYQAALRSVTYVNTSDTPTTTTRTVAWSGYDGTTNSAPVTSTITVAAANDAPVLTAGGALAYTEGAPAHGAGHDGHGGRCRTTPTLTGGHRATHGELPERAGYFSLRQYPGTITGAAFTAATGTLTLTGTDTLAAYQAALRSVTYQNPSAAPSTAARTVTWIGSDGTATSAPVTSTITVTAVNSAPVLTAGGTLELHREPTAASDRPDAHGRRCR